MKKKLKSIEIRDIKEKELKNGYYIKIGYMHGDADGESDEELGPFNASQMELLIDAIETCDRLVDIYKRSSFSGKYRENCENTDGFKRWFDEDAFEENLTLHGCLEDDKNILICPGIEMDMFDYESLAIFVSYFVYFYDNGVEYNCKLNWN